MEEEAISVVKLSFWMCLQGELLCKYDVALKFVFVQSAAKLFEHLR